MNSHEYAMKAAGEAARIVSAVDVDELDAAAGQILAAKAIFVAGAGRSLLMLKAFAMRLMHFGLTAYVVGETSTPAITADDLLLVASGSGKTETILVMAKKAVSSGANLVVATASGESPLTDIARHLVLIPAGSKTGGGYASWQPAGNSFEQSLLFVLDGIALYIAETRGLTFSEKLQLHANLE